MSASPHYLGDMTDVFARIVGQDSAVTAMRQFARNPVHAYLFSGPVGSGLHDVVVTFSAALQCENHGCGSCETCRLALSELDTDVHFAERTGISWRIDELREAERISRRRPIGGGYQIVVIEDVELTTTGASPSASALLKSLEEPPQKTIFLLTAEDLPEQLTTIMSRCVEIKLKSLSEEDLEALLIRDGAIPQAARTAALAANGNLRRAQVLVRDAELAKRIAQWRTIPDRLRGSTSDAAILVEELTSAIDAAIAPLQVMQDEELQMLIANAKEMGQRSVANRKDIEAQFKREQRRFRIEELKFGFTALTNAYRERLTDGLAEVEENAARGEHRVGASMKAIEAVAGTSRLLTLNVDEGLLLNDLMLTLMQL